MKRLLTIVVLLIVSGSALYVGGCASSANDRPYNLTGDTQDGRIPTAPRVYAPYHQQARDANRIDLH